MTQKNKNILLVVGFVLVLFIVYQGILSKTFALKHEVHLLREQTLQSNQLAQLSSNLNQREQYADSILKKNNIKGSSIQNNLLEFLNKESLNGDLKISTFKEPHKIDDANGSISSYQFTLKGDFHDLLQVIYKIEQDHNFGQVSHLNFEKKRDYRKRKYYLECSVIIENFISE